MRPTELSATPLTWRDRRFTLIYSQESVFFLDLHGLPLATLSQRLGLEIALDKGDAAGPVHQLRQYLAGERRTFSVSLDLHGTSFQRAVWDETRRIPYGKARTYGEIATAIGRPRAARAVGAALNVNPIPIFIPCHRVIGKNGALVGFNGGVALKEHLLALENARI